MSNAGNETRQPQIETALGEVATGDASFGIEAASNMLVALKDYFMRLMAAHSQSNLEVSDNPLPEGNASLYHELDV